MLGSFMHSNLKATRESSLPAPMAKSTALSKSIGYSQNYRYSSVETTRGPHQVLSVGGTSYSVISEHQTSQVG